MNVTELKTKNYTFSVVMATYNMEEFVEEALNSLIKQTFPLSEIQIIIVDDGSTDNTGDICRKYAKKYPESITYVLKENGGVASARNEGLKHISGKYVNFMDPDDIMDLNAFKLAHDFIIKYGDAVDAIVIPIKLFGGQIIEHWSNFIFEKGTRIIDLWQEYETQINHVNSAFILTDSIGNIRFDDRLTNGEDSKFILEILARKMKLGVIAGCYYHYRYRYDSLMRVNHDDVRWYSNYLKCLVFEIIEIYKNLYEVIPKFIQYELLGNVRRRFYSYAKPNDIVNKEIFNEYKNQLFEFVKIVDDDIILKQKKLENQHKCFVLSKKYNMQPKVQKTKNDIVISVNGIKIGKISNQTVTMEFLHIKHNNVKLKCSIELFGLNRNKTIRTFLTINNDVIYPSEQKTIVEDKIFGERPYFKIECVYSINANNRDYNEIKKFGIIYENTKIIFKSINFGYFFPIDSQYKNQYYSKDGWTTGLRENTIYIKRCNIIDLIKNEFEFDYELIKSLEPNNLIKCIVHPFIKIIRKIRTDKKLLITDRVDKADDNGEALLNYILQNTNKKPIFAISKNCPDYKRISKITKTVDFFSVRYYFHYLISSAIVSSNEEKYIFRPIEERYHFRDILCDIKHVYVQHGITINNASKKLNRNITGVDAITISTPEEHDSFLKYNYRYNEKQIWLTGLPRYDKLNDNRKKIVTLMPTKNKHLIKISNKGICYTVKNFHRSNYFSFYSSLINDEKLTSALKEYGYKLHFVQHPDMRIYNGSFTGNEYVEIIDIINTPYAKIINESSLLVTDSPSIAFDFAYLHKPIVYCHHNNATPPKSNDSNNNACLQDNNKIFETITDSVESTIDVIIDNLRNDCLMSNEYIERINKIFTYTDKKNSERVFNKIIELIEH